MATKRTKGDGVAVNDQEKRSAIVGSPTLVYPVQLIWRCGSKLLLSSALMYDDKGLRKTAAQHVLRRLCRMDVGCHEDPGRVDLRHAIAPTSSTSHHALVPGFVRCGQAWRWRRVGAAVENEDLLDLFCSSSGWCSKRI